MKKKFVSIALVIVVLLSYVVSASASPLERATQNSYGLTDSQVMQERDQIDGGMYGDYAQRFAALGLTFDDVKALQNQGLSYNAILQMGPTTRSRLSVTRAAAPSTFVRVTNVAGSTEYFHPDTNMVAGDFYDKNDGNWIEEQVENFITNVYGEVAGAYMYWLWGEWDTTYQTHQGHDQWQGAGKELYSAHDGNVYALGATGRICIYDEDAGVTYIYAHCEDIQVGEGDDVLAGDLIAHEGKVGAKGYHLHFEVGNGKTGYMGLQNKNLSTLNPYDYM